MVRKAFYLTEEQVKFLEGLGNLSLAEHVRRAIDEYIRKMMESSISTSPSRMRILRGGEEITDEQ